MRLNRPFRTRANSTFSLTQRRPGDLSFTSPISRCRLFSLLFVFCCVVLLHFIVSRLSGILPDPPPPTWPLCQHSRRFPSDRPLTPQLHHLTSSHAAPPEVDSQMVPSQHGELLQWQSILRPAGPDSPL
jgi:hypothetical protein